MTGKYLITINVWPFSTDAGATLDQEAVGPKEQSFTVSASEFEDAYRQADLILRGIRTNPRVWQAPIRSIAFQG